MTINVFPLHRSALPDSGRNQNFDTFVGSMKDLAAQNAIDWDIPLDSRGIALPGTAWNLRKIVNDGRPKSAVLRRFNLSSDAWRPAIQACLVVPMVLFPLNGRTS